jgi:hypothetical protein
MINVRGVMSWAREVGIGTHDLMFLSGCGVISHPFIGLSVTKEMNYGTAD